jgi:hypothetical protein
MRAGRLERVKPILLSIETPEHRLAACTARGERKCMGGGVAAVTPWQEGREPWRIETQERIGSGTAANPRRPDERTSDQARKPL